MGTDCPSPNLGTFCHKINGDKSSRGRIVQGTDRPGDGSSRGRFVQGTFRPGDGSSKRRIVQVTDRPGDGSSRGRFVQGTDRPRDGSSRGRIVQGTFRPGDGSLQKSRGRIVTGTDPSGTHRPGTNLKSCSILIAFYLFGKTLLVIDVRTPYFLNLSIGHWHFTAQVDTALP
jgi:hypothetical protein